MRRRRITIFLLLPSQRLLQWRMSLILPPRWISLPRANQELLLPSPSLLMSLRRCPADQQPGRVGRAFPNGVRLWHKVPKASTWTFGNSGTSRRNSFQRAPAAVAPNARSHQAIPSKNLDAAAAVESHTPKCRCHPLATSASSAFLMRSPAGQPKAMTSPVGLGRSRHATQGLLRASPRERVRDTWWLADRRGGAALLLFTEQASACPAPPPRCHTAVLLRLTIG